MVRPLAPAGLGKTYELRFLAQLEQELGLQVRFKRLAMLATTVDRLEAQLTALAVDLTANSTIYLDALDEAMVPIRAAGIVVAMWIRERLTARPRLRISCRSAVWPSEVWTAIHEVYGSDASMASLEPLSEAEIRTIVAGKGIDGDTFISGVHQKRVLPLAAQPLTLEMLTKVFLANGGSLPGSRRDLFSDGVTLLSRERYERHELGTVAPVSPAVILTAAEQLATLSLLCGREVIDLSDNTADGTLGLVELARLPVDGKPFDHELLRAIGASGLCEGDGQGRFIFAHRQIAEYLAGRCIRLAA